MRDEHRQTLSDIPADELKHMILSLMQEEQAQKAPRPRKPDMRSPLEVQESERKKASKYEAALTERE